MCHLAKRYAREMGWGKAMLNTKLCRDGRGEKMWGGIEGSKGFAPTSTSRLNPPLFTESMLDVKSRTEARHLAGGMLSFLPAGHLS